jgi:hypothetical protein
MTHVAPPVGSPAGAMPPACSRLFVTCPAAASERQSIRPLARGRHGGV